MDDIFSTDFTDAGVASERDFAMNVDGLSLPALDVDFSDYSISSSASESDTSSSAVLAPPCRVQSFGVQILLTADDPQNVSSVVDSNTEGNTCISVSTTFFPQSDADNPTDLIILASDAVFFYVHWNRLYSASQNGFNGHLPIERENADLDPIVSLPESSPVVNILLHTIYDLSCAHYCPSLEDLSAAVVACKVYGLPLKTYVAVGTPLYQSLLSFAPTNSLEVYALAASHDLADLAITTSSHLLSFQFPTLTDEMATKMGPVYSKKLFFLHLGRTNVLKRLLVNPPPPHAPTQTCNFTEQKAVTRAWSLATAYLMWEARPDLSASTIEATLHPLADLLTCDQCRTTLLDRIREVVVQWSMVKRTI